MEDSELILAYDFGGTKVAIALATVDGQILESITFKTKTYEAAKDIVIHALVLGDKLTKHNGYDIRQIKSIGISTMGITLSDKVIMAPNVPGWEDLEIYKLFKERFPKVDISIENDVKAAAIAELRSGELKDTDIGLYINLGTGISAVFTIMGGIIRGYNGSSGEIAYLLRTIDEPKGYYDGVSPLEESVGGKAIGEQATKYFGRELTTEEVFEIIRNGDQEASQFMNRILKEIAFHVTNICTMWNPQKLVIGGGMVNAKDIIFPILNDYLGRFTPFPPTLTASKYDHGAGLMGALELAKSNHTSVK